MSSPNALAERLLVEARKKTARHESKTLGKAAVIVAAIAFVLSPICLIGWGLGAVALGMGYSATQRPVSVGRGRIAIALGVAAIVVATVVFRMVTAGR